MTNKAKNKVRQLEIMDEIQKIFDSLNEIGINNEMILDVLENIYWALKVNDEEILFILENLLSPDSKYHVIIRVLRRQWHKLKI